MASRADVPDFLDAWLLVFSVGPGGLAGDTEPAALEREVLSCPLTTPDSSSSFPKGRKRSSRTAGDILSWGSLEVKESRGLARVGSRMGLSASWF